MASKPAPLPGWSLRVWSILSAAVLTAGAMALTAGFLFQQARNDEREAALVHLESRTDRATARVQQLLEAAELCIESGARRTPDQPPTTLDAWLDLFERMIPAFEQRPELTYLGFGAAANGDYAYLRRQPDGSLFFWLHIDDTDGKALREYRVINGNLHLDSTSGEVDYDPRLRPFFQQAAETRRPAWTQIYPFLELRRPSEAPTGVSYALPVMQANGELFGVWNADYDLSSLSAFMAGLKREIGLHAILVDRFDSGFRIIAHPDAANSETPVTLDELNNIAAADPLLPPEWQETTTDSLRTFARDRDDFLASRRSLPDPFPRWEIIVTAPARTLQVAVRGFAMPIVISAALAGGIALLLAGLYSAYFGRIFRVSLAAVDPDGARDAGHLRFPRVAPRELRTMHRAIEAFAEQLKRRDVSLTAANARLAAEIENRDRNDALMEAIFANLPFDIWVMDANGVYTAQNPHAINTHADVRGLRIRDLPLAPEVMADWESRTARALRGEVVLHHYTTVQNGETRHYHTIEAPVRRGDECIGTIGVKIDLTEQNRMAQALREEQIRTSRHLENTPLAVIDFNPDFTVHSWNSAATNLFGWTEEEVVGRHVDFLMPLDARGKIHQRWNLDSLSSENTRDYLKNLTSDGRVIDCEWYNTAIRREDGEIGGVSCLVLDVTERLAAERLFRESEDRFNKAFHLSPTPLCMLDRSRAELIDANDRWFEVFRCTREQAIGRTSADLDLWPDLAERRRFYAAMDNQGEVRDMQTKMRRADGDPIDVLISASRINVGAQSCILVHVTDITAREAAARSLRESQAFLASILAQIPGMVYRADLDADRAPRWISAGCENLTGYAPEAFRRAEAPVRLAELIVPEDRPRVEAEIQTALNAVTRHRTFFVEYRFVRADGQIRWMGERAEVFRDPEKQTDFLVGFATDISPRKQAEIELRRLNQTLESRIEERTRALAAANSRLTEVDRLKTEFLSTMSHELRTPLNAILGFSAILGQGMAGPLNPEQQTQIDLVHQSAGHLLSLINDLLDISRIESGRLVFSREEVDVGQILRAVESTLRPQLAHLTIAYRTELPDALPIIVSDHQRLFQVVLNLANNAVKFTSEGSVTVAAQPRPGGGIEITVTDTGIGIRPEDVDRLFNAFEQVDHSSRRRFEGAGLGLFLVRRLLENLGGSVTVSSHLGKGSRFTVELPAAAPLPTAHPFNPTHA